VKVYWILQSSWPRWSKTIRIMRRLSRSYCRPKARGPRLLSARTVWPNYMRAHPHSLHAAHATPPRRAEIERSVLPRVDVIALTAAEYGRWSRCADGGFSGGVVRRHSSPLGAEGRCERLYTLNVGIFALWPRGFSGPHLRTLTITAGRRRVIRWPVPQERRMKRAIVLSVICAALAWGNPPVGFKKIFNGKNLKGWHVSQVNHHGNAPCASKRRTLGTQDNRATAAFCSRQEVQELRGLPGVNPTSTATAGCFCARAKRAKPTR